MKNRLRRLLAALGRAIVSPIAGASDSFMSAPKQSQAKRTGFALVAIGVVTIVITLAITLAAPWGQPMRITYAGNWSLVELQRQADAGNVVTITLSNGDPAIDVQGAASPIPTGATLDQLTAANKWILVAQATNGQYMIVDLSITAPEALNSLRAAGYGKLFSKEALQVTPRTVPLNNGPGILDFVYLGAIALLFIWIFRRLGAAFNISKRLGKQHKGNPAANVKAVTFADVAGCEEAKLELSETVEALKSPERFAAMGARTPRGVLLYGPPGTGKCVAGDSLVLTNKGLIRIDEVPIYFAVGPSGVVHGAKLSSFDVQGMKPMSAKASHWYALGRQATRRVTVRQGMQLEGTLEHPILVMGEDGFLTWRRMDELVTGDIVAMRYNTQSFGKRTSVDTETAYLLGLLTGDGNMSISNRVTLTSADPELVDFFCRYMSERYDYRPYQRTRIDYDVSSWGIKSDLIRAGMTTLLSYDKEVPASILQAPKEVGVAFLRGLFDADGHFSRGAFEYGTSSKRMGQQVAAMLLNFGIVPKLMTREGKRTHQRISISGTSLIAFREQIGFNLARKQATLDGYVLDRQNGSGYNTNVDVMPSLAAHMRSARNEVKAVNGPTSVLTTVMYTSGGILGRISRESLRTVVGILPSGENDLASGHLRDLLAADLFFSSIKEITPGEAEVFDFTVPGSHSFVANGIVSHNTMLARATAAAAGVAFIQVPGSAFVELFAGQGARHVREVFDEARKAGRAVIFIDELDAVGRKRSAGLTTNDEREQTLNELLTQLDGFDSTDDIVVIGATNRLDVLDEALLRPGRFTRKVHVGLPDVEGRRAIIEVHAKGKPIEADVDLQDLAERTAGFSGAAIADLLNEAGIFAARRAGGSITRDDVRQGWLKTAVGPGRQRSMPPRERAIIAAHEAGHALCSLKHDGRRRLMEISLFQHGEALGITVNASDDNNLPLESELRALLVTMMGGRAAEEMLFSDLTAGASKDFEQATELATKMITRWGLGYDPDETELGSSGRGSLSLVVADDGPAVSDDMKAARARAISDILNRAYSEARRTLLEFRDDLTRASAYLFEHERIDGKTFAAVIAHELTPSEGAEVAWRTASERYRSDDEVERWLQMKTPPLGIAGARLP